MRFGADRQAHEPFRRMAAAFRGACSRCAATLSVKIACVCVGLFVVVALLDATRVVDRQVAVSFLGLSHYGVWGRLWLHQFLTAPFLHASVVHLLFNMLTLCMLGPSVETILGRRRYIMLTLLCAATSMVAAFVAAAGTTTITLGYSGVIFGILVAQAVFFPNRTIIVFWFFPMRMRHAVLLFGAVELYLTVAPERAGIAHAAHLFGALAAFVFLRRLKASARSGVKRAAREARPAAVVRDEARRPKRIPDKL